MQIDRTAWADAYKFHAEALEKLGEMEQGAFWEWMGAKMIEVSNANGNGALIMALLFAVFDDLEQHDKAREHTEGAA